MNAFAIVTTPPPAEQDDVAWALAHGVRIDLHRESRGLCRRVPGPCPHVLCRHNLQLLEGNTPHTERQIQEPCALVHAARGAMIGEEVGAVMGVCRERVRQIEARARKRIRARFPWLADVFEAAVANRPDGQAWPAPIADEKWRDRRRRRNITPGSW